VMGMAPGTGAAPKGKLERIHLSGEPIESFKIEKPETTLGRTKGDLTFKTDPYMSGEHAKIVFDVDYRPNLWGLAGHGAGESRYIASDRVSQHLQPILAECDLIVGTEEEVKIAGGADDVLTALRNVRVRSGATIVLKRGPKGCTVFPDAIPADIDQGIVGSGFPIEVYNVLGAGDAFMSGFLRGWLTGEALETCATWANACGAFAVSRLLCAPEYPTWAELEHFLAHGSCERALRRDETLNHIHRATTRRRRWPTITALAMSQGFAAVAVLFFIVLFAASLVMRRVEARLHRGAGR